MKHRNGDVVGGKYSEILGVYISAFCRNSMDAPVIVY